MEMMLVCWVHLVTAQPGQHIVLMSAWPLVSVQEVLVTDQGFESKSSWHLVSAQEVLVAGQGFALMSAWS